jgi:chemotaxis-related protein WspB
MLLVLCYAGANRYAVEAQFVKEVLPRVGLHGVAQSPQWVSGLLIHRGAAIPVIDLTQHAQGKPCPNRLSSRIVVLEVDVAESGPRRLGILAERVGLRESTIAMTGPGEGVGATGDWGKLLLDDEGLLELLDVPRLVREDWQTALTPAAARAS